MRKLYIVKSTQDFEKIIKNGNCKKNSCFIIHYKKNNLPYDRYGISVSKKLGNAVFRNKYKRKIRAIIDNYKKVYINNEDYIIILRKAGANKTYAELEEKFRNLMLNKKKGLKYE